MEASVTSTLAFASRRMAAICSGFSSGLTGLTMPAVQPARSVIAASLQFGSR